MLCLVLAALVMVLALLAPMIQPLDSEGQSSSTLEHRNWSSLRSLPRKPTLLHGSPMQQWLAKSRGTWRVAHIRSQAETTGDGDYVVVLQSQMSNRFCHHVNTTVNGDAARSQPLHTREQMTLREALRLLWGEGARHDLRSFYLSSSMDDFPVSLAEPLLDFLPAGCLCDTFAGFFEEEAEIDCSESPCRDLSSRMWLAAAGVSTAAHYDVSHNLFLQADGSKTFILAPPSAHRALRLHSSWHGSRRQSQIHLPDLVGSSSAYSLLGALYRKYVRPVAANSPGPTTRVTLREGDVLYLPPVWFHHVFSETASVGVNIWTASLDGDVWNRLVGRKDQHASWIGDVCGQVASGELLGCVVHALRWLLAFQAGVPTSLGRGLLEKRVRGLIESRYAPSWEGQAGIDGFDDGPLLSKGCSSAGAPDPGLSSPPASKYAHTKLRDALRAMDAGAGDLLLDEVVEQAAAWSVGQLGGPAADGRVVRSVLVGCFMAMV